MARCFVIQGFHKKQDFPTGRMLDLDASYEVIREAVTEAGLECVRADEIRHSGTIDTPMFDQILNADLVIADLSTYNVNAAYELGVRHALRPHATIIVAESRFKYPFDFSHISIQQYTHLGDDIGRREAQRFKAALTALIQEVMKVGATDSPVYVFVPQLEPPAPRPGADEETATRTGPGTPPPPPAPAPAMSPGGATRGGAVAPPPPAGARGGAGPSGSPAGTGSSQTADQKPVRSIKSMTDEARAAIANERFVEARATLLELRKIQDATTSGGEPDHALLHMLALATYKSKQPTPRDALLDARELLLELEPETSNDTETLGLWGAIHKRLWDLQPDQILLDESITAYERGFHIRQDYYNGINFAFLLNIRADHVRNEQPAQAVADWVLAERTRVHVAKLCQKALKELPDIDDDMSDKEKAKIHEQNYWILATLEEAAVGLGDETGAKEWHDRAVAVAPANWMVQSTAEQIARLRKLLADPPGLVERKPVSTD